MTLAFSDRLLFKPIFWYQVQVCIFRQKYHKLSLSNSTMKASKFFAYTMTACTRSSRPTGAWQKITKPAKQSGAFADLSCTRTCTRSLKFVYDYAHNFFFVLPMTLEFSDRLLFKPIFWYQVCIFRQKYHKLSLSNSTMKASKFFAYTMIACTRRSRPTGAKDHKAGQTIRCVRWSKLHPYLYKKS